MWPAAAPKTGARYASSSRAAAASTRAPFSASTSKISPPGFVGWRREVLETIDLENVEGSGYVFQIEMKYRAHEAGFSIIEVPIIFPDRVAGESKMTPDIAAEALWRVWKIKLKD